MAISNWFRRKKDNAEAERRTRLLARGRIADDAVVLDIGTNDAGVVTHIFYRYTVNSVDYESSQMLDQEQQQREADYAPGAHIVVRYDPGQPGNSIVV